MKVKLISLLIVLISLSVIHTAAQSTEFTYQGRLLAGEIPANGAHDFEFLLWDEIATGTQIGSTVTLTNVNVNNGVFSVRIDFGDQFPGANRFLEIKVRQSGTGSPFSSLAPRQAISSAPYAIKSLNAENAATAVTAANANQLGGVGAGQFVITNDPRMTDARQPLPSSGHYIQNSNTPQAASNFNVSGTGTADVLNATTRFEIGGQPVLSSPGTGNLFVGRSAGGSNLGTNNTMIGAFSNAFTINGLPPMYVNATAIGARATVTQSNSLVLGSINGVSGATGDTRVGIGTTAPSAKLTVAGRGLYTDEGAARFDLRNSVWGGGYLQHVTDAGLWQLATTAGLTRMVVAPSGNVGIGTTSPSSIFQIGTNGSNILMGHGGCGGGFVGIAFGSSFTGCSNFSLLGDGTNTYVSRPTGGSLNFMEGSLSQVSIIPGGAVRIGLSGNTQTSAAGRLNVMASSNAITTPVAVLESLGSQVPLMFSTSGTEVARIRADNSGNLVFATLSGASKDIYFRAGDDSSTPKLFIDGATGRVGIGTTSPGSNLSVSGSVSISNQLSIGNLDGSSSTHLCRSEFDLVAACTSSIRYKTNVNTLAPGMDLIRKLRPVTFNWKRNNASEIGLIAEEVAAVEPRLTFNNRGGEIEGVNYDSVGVVLVNAVNEQQSEIEAQRERIHKLESQVDLLTRLLCAQNPSAEVCGPKN